ncbi:MAG: prefoldin subunit alpha [Candidatus Aenigmarchaeota archaeon ex4484_224]|nr:MAG: prefoldin subunit alpha [Candidatus Aenigmarchaeota archaeon ex4484_224]
MQKKEFQEKILIYQILESRLNSLLKQKEILSQKLLEISQTLQTLNEINENETFFSLGSGIFSKGKITDPNKFLVFIGSNTSIEMEKSEAISFLERRKEEIEKALNEIAKEESKLIEQLNQISKEISKFSQNVQ